MIPTSYHIVLILAGAKWRWHIEDDELNAVKRGASGEYGTACADALAAFDALRQAEQNTLLTARKTT